ncbi:mechanosensitive ion channel family protein [Pleurocapsa sp. FMAR1]|uniref:mechanosensitive ion channel family protein n=1 Tax=Pleurocapsa sp. FMAR1 TaxID=3040204 RepID=UPI0029C723D1|nr:mechanosensitive ion channel family protein [Pleurocapsa sp. FMAR1]
MLFSLARLKFLLTIALAVGLICITLPTIAQTSNSPTNTPSTPKSSGVNLFSSLSSLSNSTATPTTEWIWLDGRKVFQVTALDSNLPERIRIIKRNLKQISNAYFQSRSDDLQATVTNIDGLPTININGRYLLTVTDLDAKLRNVSSFTWAQQLSQILRQALIKAKQERQPKFLIRQGKIAGGIFGLVAIANLILLKLRRRIQLTRTKTQAAVGTENIASKLQIKSSLQAIENRLLLDVQILLWLGGILASLYLFPYTRALQVWLLNGLGIPFKIGLVVLGIYTAIRLSHVFIDRFVSSINTNPFISPIATERSQLRVSTIFSAIKWVAIICWLVVGAIVGLILFGIDLAPLLAGAGLLGVALSLASQNLIKDTINGFLIVLEDQYGIGDIIDTGTWSGTVEELNLRITQLRNSEGKLITIPNSQMGAVANLTKSWSRVDLNIPVAYETDTLAAIKIIEATAIEMSRDPQWQWQIVETPQVMGIDDFSDRGLMVKIWIKTRPLKQFDVAREYRLRLKLAFDKAGILIPVPQQNISVHPNSVSNSSFFKADHS